MTWRGAFGGPWRESNLFFHYTHDLDDISFRAIQEGQKLMVDFAEYPSVIVRSLAGRSLCWYCHQYPRDMMSGSSACSCCQLDLHRYSQKALD